MFHIRLRFFFLVMSFDVVLFIVGLLSSYVSFCCCNEIHLFASTPRFFLIFSSLCFIIIVVVVVDVTVLYFLVLC